MVKSHFLSVCMYPKAIYANSILPFTVSLPLHSEWMHACAFSVLCTRCLWICHIRRAEWISWRNTKQSASSSSSRNTNTQPAPRTENSSLSDGWKWFRSVLFLWHTCMSQQIELILTMKCEHPAWSRQFPSTQRLYVDKLHLLFNMYSICFWLFSFYFVCCAQSLMFRFFTVLSVHKSTHSVLLLHSIRHHFLAVILWLLSIHLIAEWFLSI